MFEQLQFLQDRTAAETPAQTLARQAYQAAERADRQAAQDEAERAVALEEQQEQRAFMFRQLGVQPGAVLAEALRAQEEDFEYDACRAQMEKIERKREARRKATEYQAGQLAAVAQRSAVTDPLEAASLRALTALDDAARARRRIVEQARESQRRSYGSGRPFGGAAVRSQEVTCEECRKVGASPSESFLLHADPALPVPPAVPSEAELDMFGRLTGVPYRETGRYQRLRVGGRDWAYDKKYKEIVR